MLAASRRRKGELAEIISEQLNQSQPERALVVEANPWDLTIVRGALLEAGYSTIDCALSMRQAFEQSKLHKYQVVLIDYLLPDGDGLEFLEWMDDKSEVIMLTGSAMAASKQTRRVAHTPIVIATDALAV
jgi:CheY-like chemotaxis protein